MKKVLSEKRRDESVGYRVKGEIEAVVKVLKNKKTGEEFRKLSVVSFDVDVENDKCRERVEKILNEIEKIDLYFTKNKKYDANNLRNGATIKVVTKKAWFFKDENKDVARFLVDSEEALIRIF